MLTHGQCELQYEASDIKKKKKNNLLNYAGSFNFSTTFLQTTHFGKVKF